MKISYPRVECGVMWYEETEDISVLEEGRVYTYIRVNTTGHKYRVNKNTLEVQSRPYNVPKPKIKFEF